MKESMPLPTSKPEQPEKISPKDKSDGSFKNLAEQIFESFQKRPDKPKYSYELQNKLAELSDLGPESVKEFTESKKDKKHVGSMWPPLEAAKLFLTSKEADHIPVDKQIELYHKVQKALKDLEKARERQFISDELVREVATLIQEIKFYF